jgi:hypothetical protein
MTTRHDNVSADPPRNGARASLLVPPSTPTSALPALALVGREHDPFTVMAQWAARHVPPPYFQPATDGPGILLADRVGPVLAYTLLTLVTIPLTAAIAYVHARHVIGPGLGAGVAALLFALAPFHVAHAAYHVHIAQVQWIPLFFLTLWRLVERPSALRAVAAAAALLLQAAASIYLGFFAAIAGGAAAVSGALVTGRRPGWCSRLWRSPRHSC